MHIVDLQRVNKTEILQYNGSFLSLVGVKKFADQSALGRFLHWMPPPAMRGMVRLHDWLRKELFA